MIKDGSILRVLLSAVLWCVLMATVGATMIAYGIYLLIGVAWSFIAAGVFFILAAAFLRKGMIRA